MWCLRGVWSSISGKGIIINPVFQTLGVIFDFPPHPSLLPYNPSASALILSSIYISNLLTPLCLYCHHHRFSPGWLLLSWQLASLFSIPFSPSPKFIFYLCFPSIFFFFFFWYSWLWFITARSNLLPARTLTRDSGHAPAHPSPCHLPTRCLLPYWLCFLLLLPHMTNSASLSGFSLHVPATICLA